MEARLNQGKQQRKADRQKQRIPQSRNRQEKPPLLENLEKNQRQELLGNRHKANIADAPSNTDEGQEARESQEPPTNWGGAGETDNNSVPFSSGRK